MATISSIWIVQKNVQITNNPKSLGLWFSEGWRKQNISVSHYEKLKNGCYFINIDHIDKFQITNPPKIRVSSFLSVNGNEISVLAIMKKMKNGHHFINSYHTEKCQITEPPKVWVSSFPSVNVNRKSVLAIMKKLKNGHHFININHTEKFSNYQQPQKFGSPVFWVLMETEYQCQPLWKIEKWLPFHKYRPYGKMFLSLKHLSMDIYA